MDDVRTDPGDKGLQLIGRRVRIYRLVAELAQDELGERAGSGCSVLRLWRIADGLGVPVVELLDGLVRPWSRRTTSGGLAEVKNESGSAGSPPGSSRTGWPNAPVSRVSRVTLGSI